MNHRTPTYTLFPYTTLFRSEKNEKPRLPDGKNTTGNEVVCLWRTEDRPEVSADRVKCDEPEIQQADKSDDDIQSECKGDINSDLHRNFEIVGIDETEHRQQNQKNDRAEYDLQS